MPRFLSRILLFIVALLILSACESDRAQSTQAMTVATQYLEALKTNDLETASSYFGGQMTQEEWLAQLQSRQEKHGTLLNYEHKHTEMNTVFSGKFFVMEFNNTYSQGEVTEFITLFAGVSGTGDEDIKIMAIK